MTGPSPLLRLAGTAIPTIPNDLTTGFFKGVGQDNCPGLDGRVTHACMNKDEETIDPTTGAVTNPKTLRGLKGNNAQNAVAGAIAGTKQ